MELCGVFPTFQGTCLFPKRFTGVDDGIQLCDGFFGRKHFPIGVHGTGLDQEPEIQHLSDLVTLERGDFVSELGNALQQTFVAEFNEGFPDGGLADIELRYKRLDVDNVVAFVGAVYDPVQNNFMILVF